MAASQMHGVPLVDVEYCLQTHPHSDHLDLSHFESRSPGFGVIGAPVLNFYASRETLARGRANVRARYIQLWAARSRGRAEPEFESACDRAVRADRCGVYRVTAFPASHAPGMGAMLYAVEADGRCLFYGTDTDALSEAVWQAFARLGLRFDLVILDHTYGKHKQASDHMSAGQVIEHFARMRGEGLLRPNARTMATHIAHDANPAHPELVEMAREAGYEVAYDGLVVQLW